MRLFAFASASGAALAPGCFYLRATSEGTDAGAYSPTVAQVRAGREGEERASENERAFMHILVVDYRAHNRTLGTVADFPLLDPLRLTPAQCSTLRGVTPSRPFVSSHSRGGPDEA